MIVLVISDTHKDLTDARLAIRHTMEKSLDIVIHCGDHMDDGKELEKEFPNLKFYYVPGNCDGWFFNHSEKIKIINIEDKKILFTHGDHHNIKFSYDELFRETKQRGAVIGLCGHSHVAHIERQSKTGITVVNPGSIALPRDSQYPSYAVLEIAKDRPVGIKMMIIRGQESIENPLWN